MRKTIAIFLLFVFTAAQYQRYAGLVECKLLNYFSATGQKCDCEKLIQKTGNPGEQPLLPYTHNHSHPEESYYLSAILMPAYSGQVPYRFTTLPVAILPEGISDNIEHPPPLNDLI